MAQDGENDSNDQENPPLRDTTIYIDKEEKIGPKDIK